MADKLMIARGNYYFYSFIGSIPFMRTFFIDCGNMIYSPEIFYKNCYGRYGIVAVNVEFMEQILGLFSAASAANAPFIVQTTPVARDYAGADMLIAMISGAAKQYPKAKFALHLDHGNEQHIDQALSSGGYTSVMIDASHDPFEQNLKRTRAVVEKAHAESMVVEAELGVLSGVEDDTSIDEKKALYTDPSEVEEFITATGCDSLAIAVGTSHGAYKFSGGQGIQFDILREIQDRMPGYPLVLHGGSAVNYEEIERINNAGGQLKADAKGVNPEELKKAILYGVCKINIATDTRLLWTRVVREFFRDHPEEFPPIKPGKIYMEEYKKFMLKKFDLVGATGKGGDFN